MGKDGQSQIITKIALTGLVTAGAAWLAQKLIKKNYGGFMNFKSICHEINQRLDEERENKDTTIAPCTIISQKLLKSYNGLSMNQMVIKIDERYYTTPESSDCFMPPFTEGIYLLSISKTHSIVFNKYPVFKDHLLIITKAYEKQSTRPSSNDLIATYQTLYAVKGFAFFNSSKVAGASQDHKHFQVLAYENFDNDFFKGIRKCFDQVQLQENKDAIQVQIWIYESWVYSAVKFRKVGTKDSTESYSEYLKKVFEQAMEGLSSFKDTVDFNFVMGEDFLVVIPRKSEKYQGKVSLNGFALIGSLAATSNEKAALMDQAGFNEIFDEILYTKQ